MMENKFITVAWGTASYYDHAIVINDHCVACGSKLVLFSETRPLTKKELIKMVMDAGGPDAWQYKLDTKTWKLV